MDDDVDVQC